jgi:hypothetical protein
LANCKITGVFQPSHCRGLLYDAIHGWMTGRMYGKLHEKWMTGRMDGSLHEKRSQRPLIYVTSLNPVPNAQVCVFDRTYYKITTTNNISKTSLYTTFPMYPLRPWLLKILTFALLVTREIATYS